MGNFIGPFTLRRGLCWYLSGHTAGCYAGDGLGRHVASKRRADGVEEAGLAGPDAPHQHHPGLFNCFNIRLIVLDLLHQLLLFPGGKRNIMKT